LQVRDVVGQDLSGTMPDSSPEQQARYERYLKWLRQAGVLALVMPLPSKQPLNFKADRLLLTDYLRAALAKRSKPCAVAILLTKIDLCFASAEAAQATLTDASLRSGLGPVVRVLEKSDQVAAAAIMPISVFGFDNAKGLTPSVAPHTQLDRYYLSSGEKDYVCKMAPQPYNLKSFIWWSLRAALLLKRLSVGERSGAAYERVASLLAQDLHDQENWWWTPIKEPCIH
jgi:hypothetical protein